MATQRGPDGSVRIAIGGKVGTHPWACIGWVQTGATSNMTGTDLTNLNGGWYNAFRTRFEPHLSSNVTFTFSTATGFYGGIHAAHDYAVISGTGTATGTGVQDYAACLVVSWLTTVYWRGGKPRSYLPNPTIGQLQDGSSITPAEDTALSAAAAGFHSDINGLAIAGMVPIQHGFVSFRSGNQARPVPLFFPITGAAVHPRMGTQRRRLGKWLP